MKPHGGNRPPHGIANPDKKDLEGARGYRNIFGPTEHFDRFRGHVVQQDGEAKTRDLLDRIAERMGQSYRWGNHAAGEDNPAIPSGYVYLAQLVAHDLSFLASAFPSLSDPLADQRNLRTIALNLDTMYGGGPLDKPFAYRLPDKLNSPRVMLRLGPIRSDSENRSEHGRDLPRVATAYFDHTAEHSVSGLTDVLIADPRNDAQPIIAQTLILFGMLHNAIYHRLRAANHPASDRDLFAASRRTVTAVYSLLIEEDLLSRLLNSDVYRYYSNRENKRSDVTTDPAMPVEFSHAAFRCGHVMVRPIYEFDGENEFNLRDLLQTNSSTLPDHMPLGPEWWINWCRFYEIDSTRPNLSRRIAPYFLPTFFDQRMFGTRDGSVKGLAHRDLLRGASVQMRSVRSLIDGIPRDLKKTAAEFFENRWRAVLGNWVETGTTRFTEEDKELLVRDPPLLLYVLLEAASIEDGLRLGPVGSVIVAEVIFRALDSARPGEDSFPVVKEIFAGHLPLKMPELILWLAHEYGLTHRAARFVNPEDVPHRTKEA